MEKKKDCRDVDTVKCMSKTHASKNVTDIVVTGFHFWSYFFCIFSSTYHEICAYSQIILSFCLSGLCWASTSMRTFHEVSAPEIKTAMAFCIPYKQTEHFQWATFQRLALVLRKFHDFSLSLSLKCCKTQTYAYKFFWRPFFLFDALNWIPLFHALISFIICFWANSRRRKKNIFNKHLSVTLNSMWVRAKSK